MSLSLSQEASMASSASAITTALSRLSLIRLAPKPSPSSPYTIPFCSPIPRVRNTDSDCFLQWGYIMQQTMFRIKDPKASLDFYSRVLGMSLLKRLDFPEMKFSLYFLGYEDPASAPTNSVDRTVWTFGRKATIELTHNWGTESDPEFKGYHNGNSEPRGFGHIGITVDDTYKAC